MTKYVIGLGCIMWIDENGLERFIPINTDEKTGLDYFTSEEFNDPNFAELDLVGDEEVFETRQTLTQYWDNIKKLNREDTK